MPTVPNTPIPCGHERLVLVRALNAYRCTQPTCNRLFERHERPMGDEQPTFIGRCWVCLRVVEYQADEPSLKPDHEACSNAVVAAYEQGERDERRRLS